MGQTVNYCVHITPKTTCANQAVAAVRVDLTLNVCLIHLSEAASCHGQNDSKLRTSVGLPSIELIRTSQNQTRTFSFKLKACNLKTIVTEPLKRAVWF
jgi:hypothetical protein